MVQAHELTLQFQYFKDNGAAIVIPNAKLVLQPWEGGTLNASISSDTITAASQRPITDTDTQTGASQIESRLQILMGVSQIWNFWAFQLNGYYSNEPDYTSNALSWGISHDFFQRNTTISLTGNYGSDMIENNDDPDFNESLNRWAGALSITQVLTPKVIARLSASYTFLSGFQANPYRYAERSSDFPPFDNKEVLPETRKRYTMSARINIYNSRLRAAFHPLYRYYRDDWGISSHEVDMKFYHYLFDNLIINMEYRYYHQSKANYYQPLWYQPAIYMTSYARYAEGYSLLGSLGLRYTFNVSDKPLSFFEDLLNKMGIFGNIGYYLRKADENKGIFGQFGLNWKW